jgi:hypothetical protein
MGAKKNEQPKPNRGKSTSANTSAKQSKVAPTKQPPKGKMTKYSSQEEPGDMVFEIHNQQAMRSAAT